ncbi:FK506-binding protein 3 [Bradysia coprophila]|uniref:FK506-binding protein 3 n=1 Tax=Bradysia coprophila TaxID=38358 RepID=UPI00187D7D2A|nr:FK506-binding protein 3 [Bradysia coprophila]
MYQHEDSDEDDYEGYFLKPVNGYNIADRIKSANKELFEGDSIGEPDDFTESLRKVSFRPEPDFEPSEPELDEDSSCDEEDIEAINQVLDRRDDIVLFEQEVIEIEGNEIETNEQMSNGDAVTGADDEIEEICEDINNVDLAASDESPPINENEEVADEVQSASDATFLQNDDVTSNKSSPVQSRNSKNSKNVKLQGTKSSSAKVKTTESVQHQQHHRHHHHHHNHRPNSSVHAKNSSESQFLKIQLNFKPCCEYKYLENDRLPRYCGYISQYGLSKEQLEMRERRKERLKERQSDKTAKQLQEESVKSEVNEEAFARWLQNKMRNSRSMTRNMYDYRPGKQTKNGKKKVSK